MRIDALLLLEVLLILSAALCVLAALGKPGAEPWAIAALQVASAGYVRSLRCPVAVLEITEASDARLDR